MRIEQLEHLAAVVQHGSLRRASEQLHLSQPAVSESLSKLERELGVTLLDRRRTGARISRQGRDLLQHMVGVLEAVDRLRTAAGDQTSAARVVRLGTVNAATATVLVPALRAVQEEAPDLSVEVLTLQQSQIEAGLLEGSLDLGLVNVLDGDDTPVELTSTDLVRGRPVVVLPRDHPLTAHEALTVEELRDQPFITMRSGYLMHRFVHRLFGSDLPRQRHVTDGAEMGKVMVADGLGLTVLPDFSVRGDPLERAGVLTYRPLRHDRTAVTLVLRQRREARPSPAVRAVTQALRDTALRAQTAQVPWTTATPVA